jgi:ABC-type transport system involved in cytochrome c biogenesis permease subunit
MMIRVPTVVTGLVAVVISVLVLITSLTSWRVDATVAAVLVLLGAGAALVAGGVVSALRSSRR